MRDDSSLMCTWKDQKKKISLNLLFIGRKTFFIDEKSWHFFPYPLLINNMPNFFFTEKTSEMCAKLNFNIARTRVVYTIYTWRRRGGERARESDMPIKVIGWRPSRWIYECRRRVSVMHHQKHFSLVLRIYRTKLLLRHRRNTRAPLKQKNGRR